ncbi:MAG TPA: TonB family protein [Steroidobacteraceae bacterium]|nr:TonB family protein [Steroidobacteraceae bacterium]
MTAGRAASRRPRDPVQDRLATAIFVAALVHGLFIMGVKFSAPDPDERPLPTLEIMLVPAGADDPASNESAAYLAQRTQRGSGTSEVAKRSSLPEARPQPPDAVDAPDDRDVERAAIDEPRGQDSVLGRRVLDAERLPTGTDETITSAPVFFAQPAPATPTVGLNAAANDRELHLRGKRSIDGKLLADTRESAIAAYLDGWKRRIERVGTLNFPNEARRRHLSGNPVLEVAIRADGSLEAVLVRRSSGHRELDDAAIGIVRLAAPFDPFSTALRDRYPVLRFAYEWQFLNGRLGGEGAVFTAEP